MLESFHLKNVGPASEMEMHLSERLNIITGDNGLGKSFLLDVAWWALTGTWARGKIMSSARKPPSQLSYCYRSTAGVTNHSGTYLPRIEDWNFAAKEGMVPLE